MQGTNRSGEGGGRACYVTPGLRYSSIRPPTKETPTWSEPQTTICISTSGDFHISRFSSTEVFETCVSYMDLLYSCRVFGNGVPCLEFSMAVSAGSGARRPQPAATSNKLSGINNLERKHNVRSQSRYLRALHSCRPLTRSAPSGIATELK